MNWRFDLEVRGGELVPSDFETPDRELSANENDLVLEKIGRNPIRRKRLRDAYSRKAVSRAVVIHPVRSKRVPRLVGNLRSQKFGGLPGRGRFDAIAEVDPP